MDRIDQILRNPGVTSDGHNPGLDTPPDIETDPYPTPASLVTPPAPPAPPAQPTKPSVFERLGLIRQKKAETARAIYVRHVRTLGIGSELGDGDLVALEAAMSELGIDESQFNEDRHAIHYQIVEGGKQRAHLADLERDHAAATAAYEKHHAKAAPIIEQDAALLAKAQVIGDELAPLRVTVASLDSHRRGHAELLGLGDE